MAFFDRFFKGKTAQSIPDNSRLFELLKIYERKRGKGNSYENVVLELMNGNAYLLLPSKNDHAEATGWNTLPKESTLQLNCIYNLDGLRVLGAFTDETSLLKWAKKPTQYTALPSKDILKLCEDNEIARIVINSDQPDMFVLERSTGNMNTITVPENTAITIGTPQQGLSRNTMQKLIEQFEKIEVIDEVFQYGQTRNQKYSLVLGFKLLTVSENAKKATINAVQHAIQGEKLDWPLDLYFIENDEGYQKVRGIEKSLFYKR